MEFIQSKWKLLGGVVLTLVVVTILIVLLTRTSNEQPQCAFSKVKPIPGEANDVASDDMTALASSSGYIEVYRDEERLYLPIKLKKLLLQGNPISMGLFMTMDCANISIQMNVVNKTYWLNTIDVRFERPSQWAGQTTNNVTSGQTWSCWIPYVGLSFPLDSSFICQKYFYNNCMAREEAAYLGLVFDHIKLDLYRDPKKISPGEYSRPFVYC